MESEEKAVWTNLLVAIPIGIAFIFLFSFARTRITRFYHRNVLVAGHSLVRLPAGYFAWLSWILRVPEAQYLALTGLDAFSAVATFHLILFLTTCFAILGCLILAPYYYWHSDQTGLSFASFSITSLYEQTYWLPALIQLVMTGLTLYVLYHFCSSFVPLRQAFLMQPSCMSALGRVTQISDAFGSFVKGRLNLDAGTKTVLVHPISGKLRVAELEQILREAGVKGVARVQKVGLDAPVMAALGKRNGTLEKLEVSLKGVYEKLLKERASSASSKGASANDTMDPNANGSSDKQDPSSMDSNAKDQKPSSLDQPQITIKETTVLLRSLLSDESYLKPLRPRHKTSKPGKNSNVDEDGSVDSIAHFYAKLMEREADLISAIESYDSNEESINDMKDDHDDTDGMKDVNATTPPTTPVEEIEDRFVEETSFISVKKLLSFDHLGTGDQTQQWAALVHFDSPEEANRTHQLLLSAQLNEMLMRPAPSPATIIAANLNTTAWERFKGAAVANSLYLLFVFSFSPLMAALVQFMELKDLGKWFPRIAAFTQAHPSFVSFIEGVIAPYIVLRITKTTPKFIAAILTHRRPESLVQAEKRLQRYTLFFFFFQMFLISAYFSSTFKLYATFATGRGFFGILQYLREVAPSKSHFFFNFFTLQAATECMMELVNPYSMVMQRSTVFSCYRRRQPIRTLMQADSTPLEGSLGVAFSRFIIYPFFVVMVYAVICPVILLPALLYFATAFVIFKQRLLFIIRGPSETGGEFWRQACPQIINALLLGQLSMMIQMGVYRRSYPALVVMLGAALFTQFWAKSFFERTFGGKAWKTGSMVEAERAVIGKMVQKYVEEQSRREFLKEAVEGMHTGPIVGSELRDLGLLKADDPADAKDATDTIDTKDAKDARDTKDTTDTNDTKDTTDTAAEPSTTDQPNTSFLDTQVIKPYWYLCPLEPLLMPASSDASTFDPLHVDHLVEARWSGKPYSHPGMMMHSQVLMMPKNLPALLAERKNDKRESTRQQ